MTISKRTTCEHQRVIHRGYEVCSLCGLVLGRDLEVSNNREQMRITTKLSNIKNNLGSEISESEDNSRKIKRLKYFQECSKSEFNRKEIDTLKSLHNIAKQLELPKHIIENATYKYKKITSNFDVINHISCSAFCLWDAITQYKHPLNLEEMLKHFRDNGHYKTKAKSLLLRDSSLYTPLLKQLGVKTKGTKSINHYLPKLISSLKSREVERRLKKRAKNLYENQNIYLLKLQKLSFQLFDLLKPNFIGLNPFKNAGSFIYFTDKILALKNDHKRILTQELIGDLTAIPDYTIRDMFISNFKDIYKKIKKNLENEEKDD